MAIGYGNARPKECKRCKYEWHKVPIAARDSKGRTQGFLFQQCVRCGYQAQTRVYVDLNSVPA